MDAKRIVVVDSQEIVIEGIKSLLSGRKDFKVAGEALDGHAGLDRTLELRPDIVIIDPFVPGMKGLESSRLIKSGSSARRIIIYTAHFDAAVVMELFMRGISAFVLKDGPVSDLLAALEAVQKDATFFRTVASRTVAEHLRSKEVKAQKNMDRLSPREREVFALLTEGTSIKTIAEQLGLSRKTVETHKYHLMEKLRVGNMAEMIKLSMNLPGRTRSGYGQAGRRKPPDSRQRFSLG